MRTEGRTDMTKLIVALHNFANMHKDIYMISVFTDIHHAYTIINSNLTSMGPCIVNIFQYIYPTRCNFTQFIYIWKLLYMFRMVPPPIIRSAYNCIYSIWYLSHRYCCLPLNVEELELKLQFQLLHNSGR